MPGIYAWYYNHVIQSVNMNPVDIGRVFETVKRSSARPLIQLTAVASHFERWTGNLTPDRTKAMEEEVNQDDQFSDVIGRWPNEVAELYNVLQERVNSPIYIGISINLRRRLKEHRTALDKRRAFMANRPVVDQEDDIADVGVRNFAERVVDAGIADERLTVIVHPVEISTHVKMDEYQSLLVSVESVLNQKIAPIFGKK